MKTRPESRIRSFLYGALLPFNALKLIAKTPSLLLLAILPLALCGVLYYYLVQTLQADLQGWMLAWIKGTGLGEGHFLATVLTYIIKIALLILSAVTFSITAAIIAAPLNDFLAEAAERYTEIALTPVPNPSFWQRFRLIRLDLIKTVATLAGTICAILISWVPILNIVGFWTAILLLAFQYLTYPQTRRGISMQQGFGFMWAHLWTVTGFGLVLTGLLALPFISILFIPCAVVGGTLLFARAEGGRLTRQGTDVGLLR